MRPFLILLLSLVIAPANASDARKLEWSELPDPKATVFQDPFRGLHPQHLDTLRQIVRLRGRRAETKDTNALAEVTASIEKHIAWLATTGIDADALIAQRFAVRDLRRKAASAGNPQIDGQIVEMIGFTLPQARRGAKSIILLPSRVKCSHAFMPPANQMVRVLDPQNVLRRDYFTPVRVVGELRIKPSSKPVHLIDGLRILTMTFELELHRAEVLGRQETSMSSADLVDKYSQTTNDPNGAMPRRE